MSQSVNKFYFLQHSIHIEVSRCVFIVVDSAYAFYTNILFLVFVVGASLSNASAVSLARVFSSIVVATHGAASRSERICDEATADARLWYVPAAHDVSAVHGWNARLWYVPAADDAAAIVAATVAAISERSFPTALDAAASAPAPTAAAHF